MALPKHPVYVKVKVVRMIAAKWGSNLDPIVQPETRVKVIFFGKIIKTNKKVGPKDDPRRKTNTRKVFQNIFICITLSTMAEVFSPFVYWGQNQKFLFLRIDLNNIEDEDIKLTDERLEFNATASGLNGRKQYSCSIEFYLTIDEEKSKYRITERHVEFQLKKSGAETWPRLTYNIKKPAWLKIDFDHFTFDDDISTSEDEDLLNRGDNNDFIRSLEKEMDASKQEAYLDLRLVYLVMFNLFQWVGYTMVVSLLLFRLWRDGPESRSKAFSIVGDQLTTVQVCAVLEVVHPLVGWVKTGTFMPFIQFFGRNLILFGIIAVEPKVQERDIVWWLFLVWSSIEIVRFMCYIMTLIKREVWIIMWLRYTMWIPLYPLGFFCEGFIMILAMPYFEQSNKWSLELPNSLNFAFHFPTFLKCYMLAFLPGMYLLMRNMYEQRKKKLGPPSKKLKSS